MFANHSVTLCHWQILRLAVLTIWTILFQWVPPVVVPAQEAGHPVVQVVTFLKQVNLKFTRLCRRKLGIWAGVSRLQWHTRRTWSKEEVVHMRLTRVPHQLAHHDLVPKSLSLERNELLSKFCYQFYHCDFEDFCFKNHWKKPPKKQEVGKKNKKKKSSFWSVSLVTRGVIGKKNFLERIFFFFLLFACVRVCSCDKL